MKKRRDKAWTTKVASGFCNMNKPFVLTANDAPVGTSMIIDDVNNTFTIDWKNQVRELAKAFLWEKTGGVWIVDTFLKVCLIISAYRCFSN